MKFTDKNLKGKRMIRRAENVRLCGCSGLKVLTLMKVEIKIN